MLSFKLKQIGLALCLMASLLIGHASACTCTHQEENSGAAETFSPHSDGSIEETTAAGSTGNAVDDDCICSVDPPPPVVVSRPETSPHQNDNNAEIAAATLSALEFAAVSVSDTPELAFVCTRSTSRDLDALLPARAPPRL